MDNLYLLPCKEFPNGYMSPEDSLMSGFTVQNLIDAVAANEPIVDRRAVLRVFNDMLAPNLQDAHAILDANMDTIIERIKNCRGEIEEPSFDPEWVEKAEKLANDIYSLLIRYHMWIDVCIYYNGKRMSCLYIDETGRNHYDYNGQPHIEEGYDPRDYFPYVRRPNILSMSFEANLYDVINYGESPKFLQEFNSLLSRYGLYYELGNAWNLTVTEK